MAVLQKNTICLPFFKCSAELKLWICTVKRERNEKEKMGDQKSVGWQLIVKGKEIKEVGTGNLIK